jgi:hypothetical protein
MIGSVVSAFAVGKALRDKDPNWRQNKGILDLDKVPKKYSLSEINEKDRELEGKKQKKKNGGEETISTFIDAPSRVPMVASPDDRTIGKNTGASIQGQKSLGEGGEATKDAITLTTLVGITNELEKNINVGNAENSVNNEK